MKRAFLLTTIMTINIISIAVIFFIGDLLIRGDESLIQHLKITNEAKSANDNNELLDSEKKNKEKKVTVEKKTDESTSDTDEHEVSTEEFDTFDYDDNNSYEVPLHLTDEKVKVKSKKAPALTDDTLANFSDKKVEGEVRSKVGIYGDLTVGDLKQIKHLHTTACDIEGVQYLVGLESLSLESKDCNYDISLLYDLPNLDRLHLKEAQFDWLDGLSELASLEMLTLEYPSSLNREFPLSRDVLTLKDLHISDEYLNDIDGVYSTPNLISLGLYAPSLNNIEAVKSLTKLESLSLKSSSVTDLSPIKNLHNLKQLNLAHSDVEDISALSNLKSLEVINLTGTNINNVDVLLTLPSLKLVELHGTKLLDPNSSTIKQLKRQTNVAGK